jgi:hypothetical protein
MDAAHHLANLGIGRSGDGTSIQERNLAFPQVATLLKASLKQLLFERRTIRLACPATEIQKVERSHTALAFQLTRRESDSRRCLTCFASRGKQFARG